MNGYVFIRNVRLDFAMLGMGYLEELFVLCYVVVRAALRCPLILIQYQVDRYQCQDELEAQERSKDEKMALCWI